MIIPSAIAEVKVPNWIKNTADWWANNLITDNEFVNAVEFLIKEGIIKIDATAGEKTDNIPDYEPVISVEGILKTLHEMNDNQSYYNER